MTTVTWVRDGNGEYEISSPEHLKQLMNKGTLYTDAGSPPSSYYAPSTKYIQTTDIDLLNDPTNVQPIGIGVDVGGFFGRYDGGGYAISNWSYLDPNYSSSTACEVRVGLFGYTLSATIRNIVLSGVFSLQGFHTYGAFLAGFAEETDIFNIKCEFNVGTTIIRGSSTSITSSNGFVGSLVGTFDGTSATSQNVLTGVDIKGDISMNINGNVNSINIGGVLGYFVNGNASFVRNAATISGLSGLRCGGIASYASNSVLSQSINSMTGNITGGTHAGGIIGLAAGTFTEVSNVVNAMTGNITHSDTTGTYIGAGGIMGDVISLGTYDSLFNYMSGDISGVRAGGILGQASDTVAIPNSINAMNGNVTDAVVNNGSISTTVTVDTTFGLIYSTITSGTFTPLSGFSQLSGFPLPYFPISGSDTIGNTYTFEFVFANLDGNNSYTTTHLIISEGVGIYQDGALLMPSPLTISTRSVNVSVTIIEVTGAISYRITYEGPTGGEITAVSDTTSLEHNIIGLVPELSYTIRLYADTGVGYTLVETVSVTTLANSAANYDIADFTENGIIDLTSFSESTVSNVNEVMDELFTTGDIVHVNLPTKSNVVTSFINLGDTLSIKDINGLLLPFETAGGTGQDVNVTYSDDITTEAVVYDETNNNITVESVTYNPGDSFVIDGLKATVLEY